MSEKTSNTSEIILVKLGGSIITDKTKPMVVRTKILARLAQEISRAREELKTPIILGHGQGGFAHVPAKKYQTIDGFINQSSLLGMAKTQHVAAQLNRIVVESLITAKVPAVSFLMSNALVTKNKIKHLFSGEVLKGYLEHNLLPVISGDVIVDLEIGCTVWSTERIFTYLTEWLHRKTEFRVLKVIYVGEVDGVLDNNGQILPQITQQDRTKVKSMMTQTKGYDVTGGMWHKIDSALDQAKAGIESYILSGLKKDNLYQALTGGKWKGTRVS